MIKTMTEYDFTQSFLDSETRKDQFSYSALKALYDYYEQLEDDCDTRIEFDMIALCCEWSEYPTAIEAAIEHGLLPVGEDSEEKENDAIQQLQEHTEVIEFDGTVELSDGTIIGDRGVLVSEF